MLLLLFFALSAWMMSGTYIEHRIRNINTTSYRLDNPPKKFNELTIRMALVECSWQVIGPHWLLGVGAGDSYDELDKVYRKNGYQYGYKDRQDPHNEYLHTWVSTGAVGLLFLLSNFGLSLWLAQKRKDSLQVLFIVFFMMSCLFESMLSQQKGIVLFSVLNSLLVFHPGSNQPSFAGDLVRSDI
jgi:O-antigen ligase